jgi:hypothetical protein
MAWEMRNGKNVYYRSKRKGKKVSREYFGGGDAARLASALDDAKRRQKQLKGDPVEAIQRQWQEAYKPLDRLSEGTRLLMHAVLLSAGYVRGEQAGGCTMTSPVDPVIGDLQGLVDRVEAGDAAALPQLRDFLDKHPQVVGHFGDAARVAVDKWISLYANNNPLLAEGTRRKMVTWVSEIAGPNPSPLEALMSEQIAVCWLQSHYAEAMYAQAVETNASGPVLNEKAHQQDAAHQRLAASLQRLATLQELRPETMSETIKLHTPPAGLPDMKTSETGGRAS